MNGKKLKNAPLKEVIFELKWRLPSDSNGLVYDPGFDNALGLIAQFFEQNNFPVQKSLLPPNHGQVKANVVTYQFWKKELTWPVIQIGRGILTVNDIEGNYVWDESYRPTIEIALKALQECYKEALVFISVNLRYIDAVDVADEVTSAPDYIAHNFRTRIINNYPLPGTANGVNIVQVFYLSDASILSIQIQTAKNDRTGKNAIVWLTDIRKEDSTISVDILDWLDQAHAHCSQTFVDMLDQDFYASFDE